MDETTIRNRESNRTTPQLHLILKIITFLGYNPYDTQSGGLCKRIGGCRRDMSLNQRELVRRLGIDQSPFTRWESGSDQPSKEIDE